MHRALPASLRRLLADDLLRRYVAVAAMAGTLDGLTKFIAVRTLGSDELVHVSDRLSLVLVWNEGVTGGISIGPLTAQLNVLVTVLALVLVAAVVKPIAALDRRASIALGLVSGGALGNLASIVSGPKGVADFIGVKLWSDLTIVANVADLALWSGALLLAPVGVSLWARIRRERASPAVRLSAQNPM
jgi:signal peptidase II